MNDEKKKCPLCGLNAGVSVKSAFSNCSSDIACPRCGQFYASEALMSSVEAGNGIKSKIAENNWALSGWTKLLSETRKAGEENIQIDSDDLDDIINNPLVPKKDDISAKSLKLLEAIKRRTKHYGKRVDLQWAKHYPLAFAQNYEEFEALINFLGENNWIEILNQDTASVIVRLTAEGLNFSKEVVLNSQVFLATWFHKARDIKNKNLEKCVKENGFNPMCIREKAYPETIMEKAFGEIRKSRIVIADMTGLRKNVFVEVGYALALEKPVFFLHDSDYSKDDDLGFYTKQFSIKSYDKKEKHLSKIVESILGLF